MPFFTMCKLFGLFNFVVIVLLAYYVIKRIYNRATKTSSRG